MKPSSPNPLCFSHPSSSLFSFRAHMYSLRSSVPRSACPATPKRRRRPSINLSASFPPPRGASSSSQQRTTSVSSTSPRWKSVNSSLLKTCREEGAYAALNLLRELDARGEASGQNFNQTISLLVNEGHLDEAYALSVECVEKGVACVITFRPIITRCCSEGNGRIARKVWKLMRDAKIDADMFFYAELMGAFVKDHDLVNARTLVAYLHGKGRRPHTILYNTLLKGYARDADWKKAMDLVFNLIESKVAVDETTFNTLLNTCVRAGNDDAINTTIHLMESQGIRPGVSTFNTLLKLYSRRGSLNEVIKIFNEMRTLMRPSVVTYNTVIDACGHRGKMEQAAKYFDMMVEEGYEPDIVTMTSLIKGFGRARDPQRAVALFEALEEGGYEIEERTRYAVIHACFRGNDRVNARRLMEEILQLGMEVRYKTIVWALEMDIYNDDEQGALSTLEMARRSNFKIDYASKRELLRECGQRGGFSDFEAELEKIEEI